MEEDFNKRRTVKYQYFATLAANLVTLSYGSGMGWLSPALPLLTSSKSPLESGPLSVSDLSWIGSILSIGGIFGNIVAGFLVTIIGSKSTILLLGIPQLLSWSLLIFGTHAFHLNLSRVLTGFAGGGAQAAVTCYIAEIADNDVRGRLAIVYQYGRRFGVLFAIIMVSHFGYTRLGMAYIGIIGIFYCSFAFLPSTPQYFFKKDKDERAARAFRFYKGIDNQKQVISYEPELQQLKTAVKTVKQSRKFIIKELVEPKVVRAIIQAIVFPLLNQLTATYTFLTYGSKIAESAGTRISTEVVTFTLGTVQIFGIIFASQLVDRKGRKFLLTLSMAGSALGHAVMIIYLQLRSHGVDVETFHWVPVVCMSCVVMCASLGIVPLTLISLVESFPPHLRSFGVTFGGVALNLSTFSTTKMFPILEQIIQLQGCLLIFCISSTLGVAFMVLRVEETKGKDLNAVNEQNTHGNGKV